MPRDANGNYTLPAGNPVVSDTVIDTNWANPTMEDLGAEVEDSLSRSGKGGMLSPLRFPDGVVSSPTISFTSEPTTGLYRAGQSDFRATVSGVDAAAFTAAMVRMFKIIGNINGTVDAPAYSFTTDLNSGLYYAAGGDVRMSISGADVMQFVAGAARAANGSISAPSISFTSDPSSGLYRVSTNDIRISAGGVENMRFYTTGAELRDVAAGVWKPLIDAFQPAVNSPTAGSGFGGFRYTLTDAGATLNLFTT